MFREILANFKSQRERSRVWRHAETVSALLPILLVLGYVQWTFFQGTQSFTKPLELLGVILTPVLAGLFAALLLMAARAQGSAVRGARLSVAASNPLVLGLVVCLSFSGLLFHGLVIWDEPVSKAVAVCTAGIMFMLVGDLIRRHAFSPVLLIELRCYSEKHDRAEIAVAFSGNAIDTDLIYWLKDGIERRVSLGGTLPSLDDCRRLAFELPHRSASRVRIFAHRVNAEFEAEPIAGWLSYLPAENEQKPIELDSSNGRTWLDLPKKVQRLELHLC